MTHQHLGRAVLSPAARNDIRELLQWSLTHFGPEAATRYSQLLKQALRDVEADPQRFGSRQRPELPPDIYLYHLAESRDRVPGVKVKTPRHFLVYRFSSAGISVVRVIHDSRDIARHV